MRFSCAIAHLSSPSSCYSFCCTARQHNHFQLASGYIQLSSSLSLTAAYTKLSLYYYFQLLLPPSGLYITGVIRNWSWHYNKSRLPTNSFNILPSNIHTGIVPTQQSQFYPLLQAALVTVTICVPEELKSAHSYNRRFYHLALSQAY